MQNYEKESKKKDGITVMRPFEMIRKSDESGVSGVGKVLEGVVFNDGTTVIRWCTSHIANSTAIYPSFEDFKAIHITSHPTNKTEINFHVNKAVRKRMHKMGKSIQVPSVRKLQKLAGKHLHRFVTKSLETFINKEPQRFTKVMV